MDRKFKIGEKVFVNGPYEGVVIRYPYSDSNMVEIRIWDGFRLVGEVCTDDSGVQSRTEVI